MSLLDDMNNAEADKQRKFREQAEENKKAEKKKAKDKEDKRDRYPYELINI